MSMTAAVIDHGGSELPVLVAETASTASQPVDGLRPLRDPDTVALDDDDEEH